MDKPLPVRTRRILACALLLTAGWALLGQAAPQGSSGVLLPVNGAIGPATSDFFVRKLRDAADTGASVVVVAIDTPGGLDTSMRDMVQAILASDVPVVTYVSPSGARAASAGTFLMYASHIAAMAPATNLGAATPVQIGPGDGGGTNPGVSGKKDHEPRSAGAGPARGALAGPLLAEGDRKRYRILQQGTAGGDEAGP